MACRGHKELTRPPPLPLARSPLASPPAALSCRQPEWRAPRPPMPAPRPPPLPAPHPGNGPRGCQKLGRLQISWHGCRMHMCAAAMSHGMTAWHHSTWHGAHGTTAMPCVVPCSRVARSPGTHLPTTPCALVKSHALWHGSIQHPPAWPPAPPSYLTFAPRWAGKWWRPWRLPWLPPWPAGHHGQEGCSSGQEGAQHFEIRCCRRRLGCGLGLHRQRWDGMCGRMRVMPMTQHNSGYNAHHA